MIKVDKKQGQDEDGRNYGYIYRDGHDGGWFLTWMPTIEDTVDTLEVNAVYGNGGLSRLDAEGAIRRELWSNF